MLSTVVKRFYYTLGIMIFSIATAVAAPVSGSQPIAIVASLYKSFAWQILSSSENLFGKSLAQQDRAFLHRYFDPTLASLIVADRQCVERIREPCNLDFDPIFASQDPGATDLSIRPATGTIVTVEFTYPGNGERVRLDYHFVRSQGVWRIGDIRYFGTMKVSLKEILSHQLVLP